MSSINIRLRRRRRRRPFGLWFKSMELISPILKLIRPPSWNFFLFFQATHVHRLILLQASSLSQIWADDDDALSWRLLGAILPRILLLPWQPVRPASINSTKKERTNERVSQHNQQQLDEPSSRREASYFFLPHLAISRWCWTGFKESPWNNTKLVMRKVPK